MSSVTRPGQMATTPQAKHAGLRIEFEAVADTLRQGTRGAAQEIALTKRPWPFPLRRSEGRCICGTVPVTQTPRSPSRAASRDLPDATLHVSDSSDHDVGHECSDEIISVIASCVRERASTANPERTKLAKSGLFRPNQRASATEPRI